MNKTLASHFITWKIFPFSLNTSYPLGCPIMLKVLGKGGAGTGVCKHLARGAIVKIAARVVRILFIKFVKVSPEKFKAIILCLLEFNKVTDSASENEVGKKYTSIGVSILGG